GIEPLRVYSLSQIIKIDDGSVHIVNEEFPNIRFGGDGGYDKQWIYLNEQWPQKLVGELPLNAVFIPKLRLDQENSCLEEIPPFQGLMGIAPSTVIPLAGAHQNDLRNVADLTRQVPNYLLRIGRNRERLCDLIEGYVRR
ncbi:MAG: hypothetical protein PHN49_08545, partial [Candidatus Omnitrophica bacterium]|nr:hypothetical protein [Candidatus Omnitrophota bacterium]